MIKKILINRNVALLVLGGVVSLIGSEMQSFALSLYVLNETGSITSFASVLAIAMIPRILLSPFIGVLVDWFDKKKIIVLFDIIRSGILFFFFYLYSLQGMLFIHQIYALVIILSFCSIVFQPAINSIIPLIVDEEEIIKANSLNIFFINLGRLISPAIGGILLSLIGLPIILLIDAISFLLSGLSECFIMIPNLSTVTDQINLERYKTDFKEGLQYLVNNTKVMNIILFGIIINFAFEGFYSIGIIYISKEILNVSDSLYGILQSIIIISTIIASMFTNFIYKKLELEKLMFYNFIIISALLCILSLVSTSRFINLFNSNLLPFIVLTIITFIIMLITTIGNISLFTTFQTIVPNHMLGRVGTLMDTGLMLSIPMSQIFFGFLFEITSAGLSLFFSAIIMIVTVIIMRRKMQTPYLVEDIT